MGVLSTNKERTSLQGSPFVTDELQIYKNLKYKGKAENNYGDSLLA